jgi:hypothetical protein
MRSFGAIAAMVATVAMANDDVAWESIGEFKVKNVAFPVITSFEGSEEFLLSSSFGMISSGKVFVIPGIKDAVVAGDVSGLETHELDVPDFTWPNDV